MYTRCPSCKTEISFEPPANAPVGYKHRIKCPNPKCGVTISVDISSAILPQERTETLVQPITATNTSEISQQVMHAENADNTKQKKASKTKYKVRSRAFVMMLFPLAIVVFNILGLLLSLNIFDFQNAGLNAMFQNVGGLNFVYLLATDFQSIALLFQGEQLVSGIYYALQFALLVFSVITLFANFIGFCTSKFSRAWNVIFAVFALLVSAITIFAEPIIMLIAKFEFNFAELMIGTITTNSVVFALAVASAINFIASIITASVKRKPRLPKLN